MQTVLIVIHLMVVTALVTVVLLQRSEGGALGIGGGGGMLTSRGSANLLTRSTAILAVAFFATSVGLTIIAKINSNQGTVLEVPEAATTVPTEAPTSGGSGVIDLLPSSGGGNAPAPTLPGVGSPPAPSAPTNEVPTSQ